MNYRLNEALCSYFRYGLFIRIKTEHVPPKDLGECYIMDNLSLVNNELIYYHNGNAYSTDRIVPYLRKDLSQSEMIALDRLKQKTLEWYNNDHSEWHIVRHNFYVSKHVDDFHLFDRNMALEAPEWMYSNPVYVIDNNMLRDLPIPDYI